MKYSLKKDVDTKDVAEKSSLRDRELKWRIKLIFKLTFLTYVKCENELVWKQDQLDTIKYLLQNGADINAKDNQGRTAQDIASKSGNWIHQYLFSKCF